MLSIKPSRTVVVGLAVAVVVLLVGCSLMYINRASRLRTLGAEIREKQQELADSEQMAKRLSIVEENYRDAQAKFGVLEQGVSTRAYVPTLLRQLEELGKSVNLRVVGVRPKKAAEKRQAAKSAEESKGAKGKGAESEVKEEPYDRLDIDIEIKGRYWDAVSFVHKLTSFPKIIVVKDVQINPIGQPKQLGSPRLSVRLGTTAFILRETGSRPSGSEETNAEADSKRI